ncbi:MAG: hypothetical protein HY652_05255 [Acidobacteria bacterium]|nr:hypothetical protein [Acidobacteriota bacterium]
MAQKNGPIQNFLQLFLIVLSFATPCVAQETPAWEFFGGYSFQRSDVREYFKSSPILFTFRNQDVNLNGWETSVTENLNRWLGGTLDLSGHYKTPQLLGTRSRERMFSILYGPRFSYRTPSVIPFAHVLMGVAHAAVRVTPVGPHASDLSFAMAAGGGLDVNLGRKAAIRVFQADYFRTNLLGTRQNKYRASAGVVFYLGKRE